MVQAQAQKRVVQVVVAGDRGEHPLDGPLLLGAGPGRRRDLSLLFHRQHGSAIVSPAEDAGQAAQRPSPLEGEGQGEGELIRPDEVGSTGFCGHAVACLRHAQEQPEK